MTDRSIRVLVVDDTAIYRKIVSEVLADMPDVEVVGRAANGQLAIEQLQRLRPDIVTLDVEMPVMDGLQVLKHMKETGCQAGVIMLSARTERSAGATVEALKLGALDFVLKPVGQSIADNAKELREALVSRIQSLGRMQRIRTMLKTKTPAAPTASQNVPPSKKEGGYRPPPQQPHVIAVGVSTGGPQALQRFLPLLPAELDAPLLIVQHMPPVFTRSLADDLNKRSAITVCEAQDGQVVTPGWAYIAPGGRQMKLKSHGGQKQIVITQDPPENSCRPSVDYLFRSVQQHYGRHTLAIIMTGMGNDGNNGCRLIHQVGGTIFAQDQASCVVFGMPRQPVEEGLAEFVGPPERLAAEIVQLLQRKELACR